MQGYCKLLTGIAGTALAVILPLKARAGVVPVSRSSSIRLDELTGSDQYHQNRGTDQLGRFNDSLSYDHTNEPTGVHTRGTASQNTSFNLSSNGQIRGMGSLLADAFVDISATPTALGGVGADSQFSFVFDVIGQEEPFNISGTLNGPAPVLKLDDNILASTTDPQYPPVFATLLNLAPGRHTLTADIFSGSSGSSPQNPTEYGESAGLDFKMTAGSAATAIPLPPAVWTGGSGLLAAAGMIGLARWRRMRTT